MPTLTALLLIAAVSSTVAPIPSTSADRDSSNEAVVIERLETKIIFQSDGTYTRDQNARVRIQSDAGVQEYAILRPPYHSSIERIEVQDVRITKPNGTVVVTPLDEIQDAPFTVNGRAFEYSDLREKHVPIKGLEVGDTVTSSIRWRVDKPLAVGQFWFGHQFLKNKVVLDEELEVSVPKEREVRLSSQSLHPTTREESNLRIYTWKTSNSDSQTVEKQREAQSSEAMRGLLPTLDVLISSFRNWDEVGHWYESLQQEKIQPTPEVKAKAAELTKGLTNEDAKLRAIYDYVSLRIHYVGIALESRNYQPHSANEVLANQYGDCKDKHTLLASLLAAVGMKAYPALISTQTRVAEEVPSPGQFDHVISVVPKGNTLMWMDTTPEVTAIGYLFYPLRGKPALVITSDKVSFQTTPSNSPFASKYRIMSTAKLSADGTLQAHVEATFRGDNNELNYRYLFRRLPQSQWKDFAQKNFYGAHLGGTITSVKTSSPDKTDEPFTLEYDYVLKDFSGGENHRFAVPLSPQSIPPVQDRDLERKNPFWIGYEGEEEYGSQIELPSGWSAAQPNPLELKESFAEFHGSTEVKGNVVVTQRRLVIKASEVTPDQLASYKAFQKSISDNHSLAIFLHVPADIPASGPVSTPTQGLARAGELARQSLTQLPGSTNSEALQLEQDAWKSIQGNDYTPAITALRHAVALDPTFSRAWIKLGMTYYSAKEMNLSLDAFQKAVGANPKQVAPYKILAFMYIGVGKRDDAMATWKKLQTIAPDDPDLKANFSPPN